MPVLELGEVVQATGGRLASGNPEVHLSNFAIDTRRLSEGGAFFALKGRRTDGHRFLGHARRAGATAALVEQAPGEGAETPDAVVVVESVETALARCGELARKKCSARFIGLTGSTGKTTTKELTAHALSASRVHCTEGNLNNHLGVPLTLLACPADAEYAVIEMGMSAPEEIAMLTKMTDPDVGLVTNVRPAHMEFFASLDHLAAAKGELFAVLRDDGCAVVNLDDVHVRVQAARFGGRRVTFGTDKNADVVLEGYTDCFLPATQVRLRHGDAHHDFELQLPGAHNALNAAAAAAAVLATGGDLKSAVEGMRRMVPGPGRGQVHRLAAGVTVVDDSYNSSPAALTAVLQTMAGTEVNGRKILVMGDMLELGRRETHFHKEAGRKAGEAGVQLLICVGNRARVALETARKTGVAETRFEKSAAAAAETLPGIVRPGDLVVVKGSRSVGLEKVVHALTSARVESH